LCINYYYYYCSVREEDENEEDDDANKKNDEVAHALTVADAIGKPSNENSDDITLALKDLNMDNYDEEDEEGVFLFIHILNYVF
jgi:hypothetical protein